jgi:hypothetical protein
LKKVGVVSRFIKKIQGFSCKFSIFWDFSELFLYRKSHGSGVWIAGPQLALSPWWTHDHGAARPLRGSGGHRDRLERKRERRSSWFSPIASLGGRAAQMATQQRSTEVAGGAPMGRWFRAHEKKVVKSGRFRTWKR